MLNLLTDPWLPVRRLRSGRCVIRPAQIAEFHADDPIVATDWPRPDFRVSTLEFLIGLLATARPPEGNDAWLDWWHEPPGPAILDKAFARFAHAFVLDGDGPWFLQDAEDLVSGAEPVERLLIEAPGDSTISKNTDLMVHRDRVSGLGRAAAAIALYTFQSWAPAGGAGNRTGLRGGGPLVTLVLPGSAPTLWQTLWANMPIGGRTPTRSEMPLVFPWLAPTVTSEGTRVVTPQIAHDLQCWWGMPRRIRLDFTAADIPRPCDLTGSPDTVYVATWRQRPRGVNYADWGMKHPLTPHYQEKAGNEWLPVHAQPGGIGYRNWLGLVMRDKEGVRLPASAISLWRGGRWRDTGTSNTRFLAAGYDMDNMKARAFVETEMRLPAAPGVRGAHLDRLAPVLVQAAERVANLVRTAVRNALFNPGATVKLDGTLLNAVRERFWDETQKPFFAALEDVASALEAPDTAPEVWRKWLRRTALMLFDEAAPLTPDAGGTAAQRIAKARRFLSVALDGHGKAGAELFRRLGLSPRVAGESEEEKEGGMTPSTTGAIDWWRDLQADQALNRVADRTTLTRLRRCATIAEAMQDPATIGLFRRCGGADFRDLPLAGLAAAVLAHVREDDPATLRIARALGPKNIDKPETALMKPLRFHRLIHAATPDEQLTGFRCLIALVGGKLNVPDLAAAVLGWDETRRTRWVYDYWGAGQPARPNTQPAREAAP